VVPVRMADQENLDVSDLNPSLSTLARIRGTFSSRSLLIRMCPCEVVMR
jgi:hypothetical protein